MNEFLESHVRGLYRLLGHSGFYSRMGSLDCGTKQYEDYKAFGEEEVIWYARKWNGKRNIFIGRSARNKDGDVLNCNVISFDIDPVRPKGSAATASQHLEAVNAGRKILNTFPGGYLCSSGNGCLLLYSFKDILERIPGYYAKESVLRSELQQLVGEAVKIDSTNYTEAVIKVIGTLSTKGEHNLRRVARFFNYPFPPYTNSGRLLGRLNQIVPSQSVSVSGVSLSSLKSSFDGDRSRADFALVSYCKKSGLGPSDALKALEANPLGRQNDTKDQARLISKVYGQVKDGPAEGQPSYFDKLFQPYSESEQSIGTGFKSLDAAVGKFPSGELVTFAARSGFGKSTFACTVAEYLRSQKRKVLYFCTEMHRDYIMHKLVAIACNIPLDKLVEKSLNEEEVKRIRAYEQQLLLSSISICDEFQPAIEKLKSEVIANRPDLVIIDHFTHIETHWEKQMQYLNQLKEFVKDEKLSVLLLNELGEPPRGKDGGEMVSVRGDLRGTQHLLYISANLVLMSKPFEVKGDIQPVEFHIVKNRYGNGAGRTVTLRCDKVVSKFIEGAESE